MRKTKIICTLGPSTDDEQVLRQMMMNGMDAARFNFSHSDHASHKEKFDTVVRLREQLQLPIATILDTKGPEIRLGTFAEKSIVLEPGDTFTLTTEDVAGDKSRVSVSYHGLVHDVSYGNTILIDDGLIELRVLRVTATDIVCEVINGGVISDRKGVNVPDVSLSMPYISEKDRSDILFGAECGFDFIAASFTRSAQDILDIRRVLETCGCHSINIIAKIENREGVQNIDDILRVADGIMVARGDMGVEIPFEEVPVLQKMMVKKAYMAGRPVITATQMLDSMIKNPRPTRAEATDVANAIYDGTSAIMLSGETAAGRYPLEALKTMVRIATRAERDIDYVRRFRERKLHAMSDVTNAISHATCTTACDLGAKAIVTVTKSGKTARMISKYRPQQPIICGCTDERVCRQLNLAWGVRPLMIEEEQESDELFEHAMDASESTGLVTSGDLVVLTAGVPLGISGTTNMMKVQVVGHVLVSGCGINEKSVCASLCVCENEAQALKNFRSGEILVIPQTTNALFSLLKNAAGIITEQDGANSHAAIVGLAMDIPVIVGAENATHILKSGLVVNLDAERGLVSSAQR